MKTTKSRDQMLGELCNKFRSLQDSEILSRLRTLCENDSARASTLYLLNLMPGDTYYEINTDSEFEITE